MTEVTTSQIFDPWPYIHACTQCSLPSPESSQIEGRYILRKEHQQTVSRPSQRFATVGCVAVFKSLASATPQNDLANAQLGYFERSRAGLGLEKSEALG